MTEVILPHVTTKVCSRSSEKTKLPFSRRRNSCCDAENDENFPETPAGAFVEKLHKTIILLEHLHRHTSDIFFHLFYDHCREYLKPFALLFKTQSQTSQFYFTDSSFHHQMTEIKNQFYSCSKIWNLFRKVEGLPPPASPFYLLMSQISYQLSYFSIVYLLS